jgi:hypothetical protein
MKKILKKIRSFIRFSKIYHGNIFRKMFSRKLSFQDLFYLSSKTLNYRYPNDLNPFLQYIQMLNILQQDKTIKNGLEIGGGYSTVLLTKLVSENNCKITSIDINPHKYNYILPSKKYREYLFSLIDIVEDVTVNYETFSRFYREDLNKILSEYNQTELMEHMKKFINTNSGRYEPQPIESYFKDGKFVHFENILSDEILAKEKSFLDSYCHLKKKSFIDTVINQKTIYDFIFFDCGELSSLPEWFLLEKHIRVGGYAILHDIYFPKSAKNFIVATLISISDDWEILYQDDSTVQGMLVAKKNR